MVPVMPDFTNMHRRVWGLREPYVGISRETRDIIKILAGVHFTLHP